MTMIPRKVRAPKSVENDYCTNIGAARIALQIIGEILTGSNGADLQHRAVTDLIDARIQMALDRAKAAESPPS